LTHPSGCLARRPVIALSAGRGVLGWLAGLTHARKSAGWNACVSPQKRRGPKKKKKNETCAWAGRPRDGPQPHLPSARRPDVTAGTRSPQHGVVFPRSLTAGASYGLMPQPFQRVLEHGAVAPGYWRATTLGGAGLRSVRASLYSWEPVIRSEQTIRGRGPHRAGGPRRGGGRGGGGGAGGEPKSEALSCLMAFFCRPRFQLGVFWRSYFKGRAEKTGTNARLGRFGEKRRGHSKLPSGTEFDGPRGAKFRGDLAGGPARITRELRGGPVVPGGSLSRCYFSAH